MFPRQSSGLIFDESHLPGPHLGRRSTLSAGDSFGDSGGELMGSEGTNNFATTLAVSAVSAWPSLPVSALRNPAHGNL